MAKVATQGVSLSGLISVADGRATLANNGEISSALHAVDVDLLRGGALLVCPGSAVRIGEGSSMGTADRPADRGLMFSLERGALETNYTPGTYSDVVLTPDLRLLISPPGEANLRVRVSQQGDTCVDNAGDKAPYVVASSLLDGGAYRVRPGQRVLFLHGSLNEVVDNEHEPCGCPPALAAELASAKNGGPSSTPADTVFPTAVSEGLQEPPKLGGSAPVVPTGVPHAQVSATLSSATAPTPPPSAIAAAPPKPPAPKRGFLGRVGHFFSKVFGAGE